MSDFENITIRGRHIGGIRKAYAKPYIGNPHNPTYGSQPINYLGGDLSSRWKWLLKVKIILVFYAREWRG